MHVCLDGAHGAFDNQFDSDRGGEVKDDVALIDQFGGDRLVVHVLDRVMETWMFFQMANVFNAASGKVVNDKNFVAALKIRVGKMRADEARAAGD